MAETVITKGEISLNGVAYPLVGPVRGFLASRYPEKTIIGDITKDSNPRLSSVVFSDMRGGIGQDIMEGDSPHYWWESNLDSRWKQSIRLGPLATQTNDASPAASGTLRTMGMTDRYLYGVFGPDIWYYDDQTDTWADTTQDDATPPRHIYHLRAEASGTAYVMYTTGNSYFYRNSTTPTAAFTESTTNCTLLAVWDGRFWGIDSDGQLFWFTTPGTDYNDAVYLRTPAAGWNGNYPQALFEGPLPGGGTALYIFTGDGLYVHDALNQKFHRINLRSFADWDLAAGMPTYFKADALEWDGKIYMANGESIIEYDPEARTERNISFTRDFGLSSTYSGDFVWLNKSPHALYATLASGSDSRVFKFDGNGWEEIFQINGRIYRPTIAVTSTTPSALIHRLYIAQSGAPAEVWYIDLPTTILNPQFDSSYAYAASGTAKTPWFHADQTDVVKLARRLKVECLNMSANETVTISYALNYDDSSYTALTAITSNGVTTFDLPDSTTPTGVAFRSIRFKVALARGGTTTNSPRLVALTLEYRKKLEALEGGAFNIRVPERGYRGITAKDLRTNLKTARDSNTLIECSWRDNDGGDGSVYVDITGYRTIEQTARDEEGDYLVEVAEA